MKTINQKFKEIKKEHEEWGDVIIFSEAVYNRNYKLPDIRKYFNKLVNKDEYEKSEKKEIVDFLYKHTKRTPLEEPQICRKPEKSRKLLLYPNAF